MGLRNFFKFDKNKIMVFLVLYIQALFVTYFKEISHLFVYFPIAIIFNLFMIPIGLLFLVLDFYVTPLYEGGIFWGIDPTPLGHAVLFILQILWLYLLICIVMWGIRRFKK